MGGTGLVARSGKKRNAYNVLVGKPEGIRPLERPRHRWEIILEWILEKQDMRVWTGFIWLGIGTSGGLL
jgi:hypothetical protein